MGSLKTLEIPLSDILCSTCQSDSPVEHENYTPYILYDVVVDGEDDDLPLTVTLDVKKIEWQKIPSGEYIAKASILIDCPCCRNPQTLKKIMQAPLILIESLRKCKNCGTYLKLDEENVEYLETKNKKSSLSVQGKLSCDTCNEKQRININNDLPDNFWKRDSLRISLNPDEGYRRENANLMEVIRLMAGIPMGGDRHINTGGGNYIESNTGNYVEGNYINMSQDLPDAAREIQDLIDQLQRQGTTVTVAQDQVASDIATQAQNNPKIKEKLLKWGQSLGDATVSDVVKGAVKLAIRSAGIPLP
jgi:hypothetical protein